MTAISAEAGKTWSLGGMIWTSCRPILHVNAEEDHAVRLENAFHLTDLTFCLISPA